DQTMAAFTTAPLMKAALFVISCTLLVASTAQSQTPQVIEDVQVRGNRRVPAESIKYNLRTKPDQTVNVSTIERDVKALYAMGYFEDIRVVQEAGTRGIIVIFQVKERPLIRTVTYSGLQSITNSEILDKLKEQKTDIHEDSPYDPVRIKRAQSVIK